MFNSKEWRNSKWAKKHAIGKEVAKYVRRSTYWNDMHYILKIMAPMVDVIRLVDTEEKPSMGYIYKAMDICKEKVRTNLAAKTTEDEEMWHTLSRIMDKRWLDQLQQPLHAATHYLNPQVYWDTHGSPEQIESDQAIKECLLDCIGKLSEDFEEESKILAELVPYRTRRGRLGRANAIASIQSLAPRLRKRFEERVMGSEVDPIVLKAIEECQEWLDPHDARDDPVEGTNFTYGILEDSKGSENDEHPPPITRQQTYKRRRTNTNATSQPESSSRATTTSSRTSTRARSSQLYLDDSETDDDENIVLTTDDDDFNDGISSWDEEELWGN
ncbi:hypothetical protein MKW98_013086 [Papaver atlanticum]|uniref:HAT C-terminal dimerisation domain-containing protein n=1 Tax=Papaver atlanticum TaxID=357466 RepID=A0AAD4T7X0_9MAGN|nr:hypothetical protein MKW98_013086 [Papaver atlanticum]